MMFVNFVHSRSFSFVHSRSVLFAQFRSPFKIERFDFKISACKLRKAVRKKIAKKKLPNELLDAGLRFGPE